ncbi:MAG: dimethylarginine dimethylaminohydrolase family protein [Actinomycetota bacterium]
MTAQTGNLERVYVRPPSAPALSAWRSYGWHREPDPDGIAREHAAFRQALAAAGTEVVSGKTPVEGDPDAVYAYDPILITAGGAIPLRPGKEGRRGEPDASLVDLERAGVPVLDGIRPPGTAEGGDMFFLDAGTLAVGRGYRTNDAGIEQLKALLPDVQVLAFDLPHQRGPAECLHLLSLISPLDADLAVGYAPLMPVRLMEALADRGIALVEVPDEEFATMGPNVLALGGRRALALEGNPETKHRMEACGVEVRTYRGEEISRNGDGGPTCLTLPLVRG